MPHDFHRPNLDYQAESLPNNNRFIILTNSLNAPVSAKIFELEINFVIDSLRKLDNDISLIIPGNISGSNNPANANMVLTTDGQGNLPFKLITNENCQTGSISGSKLIPSSVTSLQIGDGEVVTNKIPSNAITTAKIADEAITEDKLMDFSVTNRVLADDSVDRNKIGFQAVGTEEIDDDSITTAMLKDGIITTQKIVDSNITTIKILDANVTTPKIADGAITLPKIANDVLTAAASKAEQIAGTSNTVYTNPLVQQNHPSAAKVLCMFNGTTAGTNQPNFGYNVESVTRISAGTYTINFLTNFTSSDYVVIGNCQAYNAYNALNVIIKQRYTTHCTISVAYGLGNNIVEGEMIFVAMFGTQ